MSERNLKRKTSPLDGQPGLKKNGFEERKHGEIWNFVLRHIRNPEDLSLDPPMNEKIRDGMVIWDKMKEEVDTILSAKDLYDMFHTGMLPNLAFADLSIQTKACLYYALQKPVDSEFQNQLHDVADYRLDDHNVLMAFRRKSPEEITIKDDPNDPWYCVWPDRNAENKIVEKNPEEDRVFIVDDVVDSPEQQHSFVEQYAKKNPDCAIAENSAVNNQEQQNFFIEKCAEKNPTANPEEDAENNPQVSIIDAITFTEKSCWPIAEVAQSVDDEMVAFLRNSFQSTSTSSAIDAPFPLIEISDSDLEPTEFGPSMPRGKTIKDALLEIAPGHQEINVSVDMAALAQQFIDNIADDDDIQEVANVADDDEIVYIGSQPGTGKRSSFKKENNASFREEQKTSMSTPKTPPVHSSPLESFEQEGNSSFIKEQNASMNTPKTPPVHSSPLESSGQEGKSSFIEEQNSSMNTPKTPPVHSSPLESFEQEGNSSFIEEQNALMNTPTTPSVYSSPLNSPRTPNAINQALSNVQFEEAATALDSPMDVRPPNVREQVLNLERCLGDAQIKAAQDALRITDLEKTLQKSQDDYKILHENFQTVQLRISILESQYREVNQRFDQVERELQVLRSKDNPLELSTSSTSAFFSCNSEPFFVSPVKIPQAVSPAQTAGLSNTNTPGYPVDDDETPPIIRPQRIVPKGKPANAYEDPAKKAAPKKKKASKLTSRKSKPRVTTPNAAKENENEEAEKLPTANPKRSELRKLDGSLGANKETPSRRRSTKTPIRFGV